MGAAGHGKILSPTLNHLSRCGVRYTQAYSSTPTCIPARRALMTGTTSRTHGDRTFREREPMDPNLPTMAQTFRDHGYQAYAAGKMHVYPQRDRIGFDEVILCEEGRHHLGLDNDDFELYLKDKGYSGQELVHASGTNAYNVRPWHLPEECHPTYWTTKNMCRTIQRRDPTRPAFWYCSYIGPHPPVTPPRDYFDMYREIGVDDPVIGDWARNPEAMPAALRTHRSRWAEMNEDEVRLARMAFYAQCTYIDHQMRLVIGTLREEGLLENTHIMLVCDHGDMLGNHNLWAKPPMMEWSAKIPMLLVGAANSDRVPADCEDSRLAELRDVMPTLLDLCDIPAPETVEGNSLLSGPRRDYLYCEHHEGIRAMRMVRAGDWKLIWYPVGNRFHLFNLAEDPNELKDRSEDPACRGIIEKMSEQMAQELWGSDLEWVKDGKLTGEPDNGADNICRADLLGQRGWRT